MSMRIGGLASGMDIDSIVSDLMKAEKLKLTKVEQQKQLTVWRQENYYEINRALANFVINTKTNFGLATASANGGIVSTGVNRLDWVKNAVISDTDIAGVTAYSNAVKGSYHINVTQLAENWSAASGEAISTGGLGNLATQFGISNNDTINFTITTNKGTVTVNETNLAEVSLNDIIKQVNSANIGVTAIYDSNLDRVFLQTAATGAANTVNITDNSVITGGAKFLTGADNLLEMKYLDESQVYQDITAGVTYTGKDALFDFGAASNIVQSSNTFTVNNISFTLKATGNATVTVGTNTSAVYEKITSFVQSYNELLEKIGTEMSEVRYSDYLPLSDEQKAGMEQAQITQWEDKAKNGLLRNDTVLQRLYQDFRSGMYQEVSDVTGIYDQLTSIGITTEGYSSSSRGGKLVIDETKLLNAIETDVDSVMELMFKEPGGNLNIKSESLMTSGEITQKRSESGLIRRLYDNVTVGMKQIINKAGCGDDAELYRKVNGSILVDFVVNYGSISFLDKENTEYTKKIDTINDYLIRTEDMYWRKFTAMEQAIDRMNQQSSWLAQQFGQESQ